MLGRLPIPFPEITAASIRIVNQFLASRRESAMEPLRKIDIAFAILLQHDDLTKSFADRVTITLGRRSISVITFIEII